jgi:hypothetical protein
MCLHPVIYNKQVITVQLLTRELQGGPGISASLALTKTLAMTCDIGKGRLSDVPAMRKNVFFQLRRVLQVPYGDSAIVLTTVLILMQLILHAHLST